jgi:hypothetical protein
MMRILTLAFFASSMDNIAVNAEPISFQDALSWLSKYMPEADRSNPLVNNSHFLNQTITFALKTRARWPDVPRQVFLNDVLPYAVLTEQRDDWRRLFYTSLCSDIDGLSASTVVEKLNAEAWGIVQPPIKFVAAPPNEVNRYSVFSVMSAHSSSCTGLAVFLTAVYRSCGIPARVAGTPHWNKGPKVCPHGDADGECGNHNWVEVYLADQKKWVSRFTVQ